MAVPGPAARPATPPVQRLRHDETDRTLRPRSPQHRLATDWSSKHPQRSSPTDSAPNAAPPPTTPRPPGLTTPATPATSIAASSRRPSHRKGTLWREPAKADGRRGPHHQPRGPSGSSQRPPFCCRANRRGTRPRLRVDQLLSSRTLTVSVSCSKVLALAPSKVHTWAIFTEAGSPVSLCFQESARGQQRCHGRRRTARAPPRTRRRSRRAA